MALEVVGNRTGGNFVAGTDAPSFNGIEQGNIKERATPGQGVLFSGTLTVWVAGVKQLSLANGNSANAPSAPSANPRIDVLLDDNTWISGDEAAEPVWPSITAGRAWICGVFRKASNDVIRNEDNGTDSFIIGRNWVTRSVFSRRRTAAATATGDGSYKDVTDAYLPCHYEKDGHNRVWFGLEQWTVANQAEITIRANGSDLASPDVQTSKSFFSQAGDTAWAFTNKEATSGSNVFRGRTKAGETINYDERHLYVEFIKL